MRHDTAREKIILPRNSNMGSKGQQLWSRSDESQPVHSSTLVEMYHLQVLIGLTIITTHDPIQDCFAGCISLGRAVIKWVIHLSTHTEQCLSSYQLICRHPTPGQGVHIITLACVQFIPNCPVDQALRQMIVAKTSLVSLTTGKVVRIMPCSTSRSRHIW